MSEDDITCSDNTRNMELSQQEMIPIELEYREGTLPRRLQDEIDTLHKQLNIAVEAIKVSYDAISSLPEDALGVGEIDWDGEPYKYPIRDEVIDKINKYLAEIEKVANDNQ